MASSIESLTPNNRHSKHDEFEQLTEALREQEPELYEDVDLVLHLNAELSRHDLTADRQSYLNDERRELVGELLARPEEAILAEVDMLARRYQGRSLAGVDYSGMRTTQFVTRDPERMNADVHFRLLEFPSGKSRIRIEVPSGEHGADGAGEPFFIELDSDKGLSIEQRVYERGRYQYKSIETGTDQGRDRLWRFFTHSFMATDLLDNRSVAEQQAADQQAFEMLRHKLYHS